MLLQSMCLETGVRCRTEVNLYLYQYMCNGSVVYITVCLHYALHTANRPLRAAELPLLRVKSVHVTASFEAGLRATR